MNAALAALTFAATAGTLSGAVTAEGARATFECETVTVCNSTGACGPALNQSVTFQLAPVDFADGVQTYTLAYNDVETEAWQRGDISAVPIQWTMSDENHQLVPGPAGFVWLRQWQGPAGGDTEVRFLTCAAQ